jgi:hypothetical protein
MRNSRIVGEYIDRAELSFSGGENGLNFGFHTHVSTAKRALTTGFANFFGCRISSVCIDVRRKYLRALLREE